MRRPVGRFRKIGWLNSRPQIPGPITDKWSAAAVGVPLTTSRVLRTTELHPVAYIRTDLADEHEDHQE